MQQRFSDFLAEQLLLERYINAFDDSVKRKYMQEVWDILQASYAYIGGIKGHEFSSPEAMLKVPFWKLFIKDGKVVTVRMYKDLNGRKGIASGTDGSRLGKLQMAKTLKNDLDVSYAEMSGAAETFISKHFPELYLKYRIPADQVSEIIDKEIHPSEDGYHYKRRIGSEVVEKILLGTPGKKFYGKLIEL